MHDRVVLSFPRMRGLYFLLLENVDSLSVFGVALIEKDTKLL